MIVSRSKIWIYTWIVAAVCILASLIVYLYTGQIVIILLIAPAIIHWILNKRMEEPHDKF